MLTIGYIGNGKKHKQISSANDSWGNMTGVHYTSDLDELLQDNKKTKMKNF